MYSLLQKLLFKLDAEKSHTLTLELISLLRRTRLDSLIFKPIPDMPVELMGLTFKNPIGLAAGLDKNGDHIDALSQLGFGFIEVGTVTPRPQPGNPKPRIFRLPEQQAIINRMGFNNKGIDHLIEQVKKSRYSGVLGINIGKNFDTPIEDAVEDYAIGFRKAFPHADYIAINISSPNTPGLRDLQQGENISPLLKALSNLKTELTEKHKKTTPFLVKVAPDMSIQETEQLADALLEFNVDGVIATNTTISREGVSGTLHGDEAGGLSGAPVWSKSTETLKILSARLNGAIPIIGVGGITSGEKAQEKLTAGASLIQLYSGLIYQGPNLIHEIATHLKK